MSFCKRDKNISKYKTKKKKRNQKINIIIDLDNTLLHSFEDNFQLELLSYNNYENKYNFKIKEKKFIIYTRPFTKKFLKYCFKNCNVGFWTAGNIQYCKLVINYLLDKSQKQKSIFILARKKNNKEYTVFLDIKTQKSIKTRKINNKITKPLNNVYQKYNIDPKNTVILDNNPLVLQINKKNTIVINDYFYNLHKKDTSLLIIIKWLNIINNYNYNDIRLIEKPVFIST